ncbi:SurA N-terminal domain-containing protein [Fictibacillus sp. BK138]|jgi:predicted nucleic-acid-binding protein|uniref:SurA N-terminal domain-containing protein n=1 Tax=Fictibacillus sp. BK138 TaxID=2512121 RepID=UPI0010295B2D|nr:SurA N-terminal domain-containing protein [Fictibacillus sp. BK138]RZT23807.1 SurA-like protein [Fictibacillus sp. BK138]
MKDKRTVFFGAVTLILLILVTSPGDQSFAQYIRSFADSNITYKEVLSEHEIEELTYFYEHVMKKTKKEATKTAIDRLLNDKAVQLEAKKQKLSVSDEEVQKTINIQMEHAKKIDSPELTSLLKSLDMTIEEYYQDYAYEKVRGKLLENKLFHEVTKDIQDPEEKDKVWMKEKQKLIRSFMAKNHVEIEQLKKKYL